MPPLPSLAQLVSWPGSGWGRLEEPGIAQPGQGIGKVEGAMFISLKVLELLGRGSPVIILLKPIEVTLEEGTSACNFLDKNPNLVPFVVCSPVVPVRQVRA